MKYALIGCGRISPNHIEAAKNNKLDFVAMCDILPDVMAEKSERFGLADVRKYTDYKELLEKEKPELYWFVLIIRTASISQYNICVKRWKKGVLVNCHMVLLTSVGTAEKGIMIKLRGVAPGHRMAVVL